MKKIYSHLGYMMSERQIKELDNILKENVLREYNRPKYWDKKTIKTFATYYNLSTIDELLAKK